MAALEAMSIVTCFRYACQHAGEAFHPLPLIDLEGMGLHESVGPRRYYNDKDPPPTSDADANIDQHLNFLLRGHVARHWKNDSLEDVDGDTHVRKLGTEERSDGGGLFE